MLTHSIDAVQEWLDEKNEAGGYWKDNPGDESVQEWLDEKNEAGGYWKDKRGD